MTVGNRAALQACNHLRLHSCICLHDLQVLGEHESVVKRMLDEFGVALKPSAFRKDIKPFLKDACCAIFGTATGLVDLLVQHVPSSHAGQEAKVGAWTPAGPSLA